MFGTYWQIEIHLGQIKLAYKLLLFLLFQIDSIDYELAVEIAEAALEAAGQGVGAGMATVVTAQSQLVVAVTNLVHITAKSKRVFEMEKSSVVIKSS